MRTGILFMGSTAFAFSLVLSLQLFALACGAFVSAFCKIRVDNCWNLFSLLYIIAASWLALDLLLLPSLNLFIAEHNIFLRNELGIDFFAAFCISNSTVMLFIAFIPCLLLGISLPLYFQLRQMAPSVAVIEPTHAYTINLIASIFGSLAGGALILPCLSKVSNYALSFSICLCSLAALLLALLTYVLANSAKVSSKTIVAYLSGFGAIVIFVGCFQRFLFSPLTKEKAQLLFYKEGLNATVSLSKSKTNNVIYLQTDGQTEASLPLDPLLDQSRSDQLTQISLASLPLLFVAPKNIDVFLIGLGSGVTAKTFLKNKNVKQVSVAELEPAVIQAAKVLENCYGSRLPSLISRRVAIYPMDGRNLLSLQNKTYDVIVSQAGEPWRSSSKYLYTSEFWQLAKLRMKCGGVFCQWFPLYSMDTSNFVALCQTFASVFDQVIAVRPGCAGEIILLGMNDCDEQLMNKAIKSLPRDVFYIGERDFNVWLNKHRTREYIPLNRDDYPFVQYRLQSLFLRRGVYIDKTLENPLPMKSND